MTKKKDPSLLIRKPVAGEDLKPCSRVNKSWRKRNPEKARAHARVNWAIRTGKMKRKPCVKCGNPKSHAHHDDYSKPLNVEWLCHTCHETEHHGPPEHRAETRRAYHRQLKKSQYVPRERKSKRREFAGQVKQLRSQGLTYQQIGQQLGMTKGQVYKIANETPYK